MLLVEEQGYGEVPNLLFGVFVGRDQVDSFEMAEIDIPAKDVYVQQLRRMVRVAPGTGADPNTLQTYFFLW